MDKAYEPQKYEDGIYKRWEDSGFFDPEVLVKKGIIKEDAEAFSMVLPPPNVTGTLHMGHAAMLAIEDVIARYHRMKGEKTLWVPGTDHAAIATQTKVEKLLIEKEGLKDPRHELGREEFLNRVKKFAQESHDTIVSQCKKMGASLNWKMEAFTLDEKRNAAVKMAFKKMYNDGLIYRGYRIVNWCPHCKSTLADDEVDHKEQSAKLYFFKYSADFPFAIATTRPETKLGDTGVAVNPKDKRYKKYLGKIFEVKSFAEGPALKIKIFADESVDINFGTGALGVTPAHSHADYDLAQKNNLPVIKIIDEEGKITAEGGKNYQGLDAASARKKIIQKLREQNLVAEEKDIPNSLSICYRCGTAIEPLPSKQWFVAVNKEFAFRQSNLHPLKNFKDGQKVTLKLLMQKTVEDGEIEIIPDRFVKTYFHWINNLRDWCISRQIWYGHQIPVWYKGEETYVGTESPNEKGWTQDPDTLDTWFSSGLWALSALGWPEGSNELKIYHPTSILETGYDILFFWVARMILMTTYVLGEVPFRKVYLHGLVRDENGKKMSKSLGNVIDPLDMIKKYGADATRLSLLLGNTPGNDMKLSEEKIAGFRNFANKLWNISRFALAQIQTDSLKKHITAAPVPKTLADKWILSRLNQVANLAADNIEKYNFSYAGEALRDFTWSELADWYLEIAKIEGNKSEILNYILQSILKLWHPYMPYVTEAIWQEVYGNGTLLMVENYPRGKNFALSQEVNLFDNYIVKIISGIRSLRADYKIEPAKLLNAAIGAGDKAELLKQNLEIIKKLARLESLIIDNKTDRPPQAIGFVESGVEVYIDVGGLIDTEKEKGRLAKEIAELNKYAEGLNRKLANNDFVSRAPAEVVDAEKEKLNDANLKLKKLGDQLKFLK